MSEENSPLTPDDDNSYNNSDFVPSNIDSDFEVEQNQPFPSGDADKDFDSMLDDFIAAQLSDIADEQQEIIESVKNKKPLSSQIEQEDEVVGLLYAEERALYEAYSKLIESVQFMTSDTNIELPAFEFGAAMIYQRFRPSCGRLLTNDIIKCWELMLQAQPQRLANLKASATDEEILEYAEKTTDENLQLALISYVEILIELEGCELSYNLRKAKFKKRKIEREIYEEHKRRTDKMKKFIKAISEANFPINAERLVNNYFKNARKDPEGAKKMLENNPATYAPIEINKLKPRFFGLIKPKPEDGIKVNKELGRFLKGLKA